MPVDTRRAFLYTSAMLDNIGSAVEKEYESLLRYPVKAIKSGRRPVARELLERALELGIQIPEGNQDVRPWLWLSVTVGDSQAQIEYLLQALAIDPANESAQRSVEKLQGKNMIGVSEDAPELLEFEEQSVLDEFKAELPQPLMRNYCPYLGMEDDAATALLYPSDMHQCYRTKTPIYVSLWHQENYCLDERYVTCPLYKPDWDGIVPSGLAANQKNGISLGRILSAGVFFIGMGILLVGLLLQLIYPGRTQLALWSETITPQVTSTSILMAQAMNSSPTPRDIPTFDSAYIITEESSTQLPNLTPISELATSSPTRGFRPANTTTPAPTLTPTNTLTPSITPGPLPETPFGSPQELLIIVVKPGESYALFAQTYNTTPQVLTALNPDREGKSLWPGRAIVIAPRLRTLGVLPPFQVILLEEETSLEDLIEEYNTTRQDLIKYNDLGTSYLIPGGRWLAIPIPIPTPTP